MCDTNTVASMKIFILVALTALLSCQSEQQKFVNRYKKFTTELTARQSQFTPSEWDSIRMQYKILRKDAELQKPTLTPTEQAQIDSCNHKINALIIRKEVNGVLGEVESIINEFVGTINELTK